MNVGLYAEKISFHHRAIKTSYDSQLHSRTKSLIHKNTCVFSSKERRAKDSGWVFLSGLWLLQHTKPWCQSTHTWNLRRTTKIFKRVAVFQIGSCKAAKYIYICVCVCIDSPLNVAQIPFPTTEVQHRKGSVSIYINFFQQTCLKKNLPQRKILSIHSTDVFTTVTMIKVTTREASV